MNNEYAPLTRAEYRAHELKHDGHPALYVGTYAKYNDGNLFGQWVDLTSFDDYEEFYEYVRRLHSDEEDPEIMYQDYMDFPRPLYSESGFGEDEFEAVQAYGELNDDEREAFDAYVSIFENYDVEEFHEKYIGQFSSDTDLASFIVDEIEGGVENLPTEVLQTYFDWQQYGYNLDLELPNFNGYYFWN